MITCRAGSTRGGRGPDRDGLAGADLPGDHPDRALIHTPGDPGDGFGVSGVAVQHRWCQTPPKGHAGETVIRLQPFDAHADAPFPSMPVMGKLFGHQAVAEQGVVADPPVGADLLMVGPLGQFQVVDPRRGHHRRLPGVSGRAFGCT